MDKQLIYTGIGSRKTPDATLKLMKRIGYALASQGYRLKSGGALAADTGFYDGAHQFELETNTSVTEIWLPNGSRHPLIELPTHHVQSMVDNIICCNLLKSSRVYTGVYKRTEYVRALFARNVFQIVAQGTLNPESNMVIYWAPLSDKGEVCGGTRIAVLLAQYFKIPTYNLLIGKDRTYVLDLCNIKDETIW